MIASATFDVPERAAAAIRGPEAASREMREMREVGATGTAHGARTAGRLTRGWGTTRGRHAPMAGLPVTHARAARCAEADERAWLDAAFAPTALGARYQRVRELGRGGMGVVVLARDLVLHRVVALKLQHPLLAASDADRMRFRREARIQAQLAHPGIVPLLAFDEVTLADGGRMPYLAMPYVAGESLAERLRREGPLPADEVRRLLDELLAALAYAHGEGVVHRDLKPENVLLARGAEGEPPRALLTDFGVAARPSHDDPRTADHGAGTPLFMAPEQFAGEHAIDGRTDLYALGALAYTMLAGRPPVDGRSARSVAVAQLVGQVPPLAGLAPRAPRPLVDAVERCLARDPAQRWASAEALRVALRETSRAGRLWRDARAGLRAAVSLLTRPFALL